MSSVICLGLQNRPARDLWAMGCMVELHCIQLRLRTWVVYNVNSQV